MHPGTRCCRALFREPSNPIADPTSARNTKQAAGQDYTISDATPRYIKRIRSNPSNRYRSITNQSPQWGGGGGEWREQNGLVEWKYLTRNGIDWKEEGLNNGKNTGWNGRNGMEWNGMEGIRSWTWPACFPRRFSAPSTKTGYVHLIFNLLTSDMYLSVPWFPLYYFIGM